MKDYGWLDTNLFVHPFFENDPQRKRCEEILEEIREGNAQGWVDIITIHELTYVLPRVSDQFSRGDDPDREKIFSFLSAILGLDGINSSDQETILEGLMVWAESDIAFADARLQVLARNGDQPVCSVNQGDFEGITNTYRDD